MIIATHVTIREGVESGAGLRSIESLVSQMKVRTEEIIAWMSSPDRQNLWRLSQLDDLHLLYEYQLMYEETLEFTFTPLLDVRDVFDKVVGDWSAASEDSASGDLAW